MRDANRLREIESELRSLTIEVRHIGDRISIDNVRSTFAKQDVYRLSAVILSAADDAKQIRVPRAAKVRA